MQSLKTLLRGNVRQYGMVIALAAILVLFQITTDGVLLRPLNLTNLLTQNSYILILAIGMVMVIIAGHIDLSVGSITAFESPRRSGPRTMPSGRWNGIG